MTADRFRALSPVAGREERAVVASGYRLRMTTVTDVCCAVHVHSLHSDGTGTVEEIARAAECAGVDAVLLTDHDTMAARDRGEERRYGRVLVCVGVEVSPAGGDHCLAFGVDGPVAHRGLSAPQIVDAVGAAGGISFPAHPFSRGSRRFERLGDGMPWSDLNTGGYTGVELWSFVTDTAESIGSLRRALGFVISPARVVDHPPRANVEAWDRLCARRRVVAIGGLDAHQLGKRIAGRVPLRLMAYRRSFSYLHTHVLAHGWTGVDADADRRSLYAGLREGRCYLAMDSLAPARGFELWVEAAERIEQGGEAVIVSGAAATLHARLPRPAAVTVLRDGEHLAARHGARIDLTLRGPGVYRLEAMLPAHGRMRTWIMSNPVYLRSG